MGEQSRALPTSWDSVRHLGDDIPRGRVEVGPKESILAPLSCINLVSQSRQEYDPDDMVELTRALTRIDDNGQGRLQLIQPMTVGYFSRDELPGYLERLNQTWDAEHAIDELVPIEGSGGQYYFIVIAGHRRTMALRLAAEQLGLDPAQLDVVVHYKDGDSMTFRDGMVTQYRENFHKRPESWEDAIAVDALLRDGIRSGDYATYADCAKDLGIPPERVSRAYQFCELPGKVQEMVQKKIMHYGSALELHKISVALTLQQIRGGGYADDAQFTEYLRRFKAGSITLADLDPLVDEHDRTQRDLSIVKHHAQRLSGATAANSTEYKKRRTIAYAKKYAAEQCDGLLLWEQLEMVTLSTEEQLEKQDQAERSSTRRSVMQAANMLLSQLLVEEARLQHGQTPAIFGSQAVVSYAHEISASLASLSDKTANFTSDELAHQTRAGIEAAEQILQLLRAEEEAAQPDVMTQATHRLFAANPDGISA